MKLTLLLPGLIGIIDVIASTEGPCDILDAAGNPCVAAHSTVRALYAKYDGPLVRFTLATLDPR